MAEIINSEVFGERLKHARDLSPYRRGMIRLADEVQRRFDKNIRASTMYSWESGRTVPSLGDLAILVDILEPDGGLRWFAPAFHESVRQSLFPDAR